MFNKLNLEFDGLEATISETSASISKTHYNKNLKK